MPPANEHGAMLDTGPTGGGRHICHAPVDEDAFGRFGVVGSVRIPTCALVPGLCCACAAAEHATADRISAPKVGCCMGDGEYGGPPVVSKRRPANPSEGVAISKRQVFPLGCCSPLQTRPHAEPRRNRDDARRSVVGCRCHRCHLQTLPDGDHRHLRGRTGFRGRHRSRRRRRSRLSRGLSTKRSSKQARRARVLLRPATPRERSRKCGTQVTCSYSHSRTRPFAGEPYALGREHNDIGRGVRSVRGARPEFACASSHFDQAGSTGIPMLG